MIKFFRHTRQSLVEQNKIGKYFKYAIGEIILVVIGILVALQINNWNQNQLEKVRSIEYHKRMLEELDFMMESFKSDSIRAHKVTEYLITSINILESDNITKNQLDTVDYSLRNYFQFVRISSTLNTYEEIKSSGDLGLIYNKDLRKSINFFIGRLNAISKIYDQLASQVNETYPLNQYIRKKVSLDSITEIDFNLNEIKKDKVLINNLSWYSDNWKTKLNFSSMIIRMIKDLKSQIQTELAND